nr:hypothetical protein [Mycobacterium uberis]
MEYDLAYRELMRTAISHGIHAAPALPGRLQTAIACTALGDTSGFTSMPMCDIFLALAQGTSRIVVFYVAVDAPRWHPVGCF